MMALNITMTIMYAPSAPSGNDEWSTLIKTLPIDCLRGCWSPPPPPPPPPPPARPAPPRQGF